MAHYRVELSPTTRRDTSRLPRDGQDLVYRQLLRLPPHKPLLAVCYRWPIVADLTFFATCPKGMEELLADEL
ncbi:MAG TPA: hypothetical protein VJ787_13285, partial [Thermoleophilia bacterium]|nr:hypothetical protein [Thermoleophilia bacterium]